MDRTDYYKLMMMRQWKTCGQKIWPVLECKATEAVETVERFLAKRRSSVRLCVVRFAGYCRHCRRVAAGIFS